MRRRMTIMAALALAIWAAGVSLAPRRPRRPSPQAGCRRGARPGRAAAPASRAGGQARRSAKMDWLLKQWEQQSSRLKTLDVTILRIDDTPAWGDLEYYEGRALFKSPNLAFIDFNKIKQDDKKKPIKDPQDQEQVRLHALRADHLHGQRGLAVQQRHPADLHLPAREGRAEEGHRGGAAAVPLQHARR